MYGSWVTWGRRLQGVAALVLMGAPLMAWGRVPLLGLTLPVPGLFLHGFAAGTVGLLVLILMITGARLPGLGLVAAVAAGVAEALDWDLVTHRTAYVLDRMQLAAMPFNDVLTHLGARPLQFAPGPGDPGRFVGDGLWVAVIATFLILAGAVVEAIGYAPTKTLASVLIGMPRCKDCRRRIRFSMAWCPGCGKRQMAGATCPRCKEWCEDDFAFCATCGLKQEAT